jgi:hypothetical protein
MKRVFVSAALLGFLAVSGLSFAKPKVNSNNSNGWNSIRSGKMWASGHLGLYMPLGDASDSYDAAIGLEPQINYAVADDLVVCGSAGYVYWIGKNESGYSYSLFSLPFRGGVKYFFSVPDYKIKPYIFAELGMHYLSSTVKYNGYSSTKTSTKPSIGFGGGVLVPSDEKLSYDIAFEYEKIFTSVKDTDTLALKIGANYLL